MAIFAIEHPLYLPAMRIIATVTATQFYQGMKLTIDTTFDHDYLDGLIVRLVIPPGFGMTQVNGLTSAIIVTDDDQFEFFIDNFLSLDPFVQPIMPVYIAAQRAQVIPVGEVNASLLSATHNVLG